MIEAAEQQLWLIRKDWSDGKASDAMQGLNLLLSRQPEFGKAHSFAGMLYFRHFMDFTAAEESFKKAMRLAPADPVLYTEYAAMLLQLEKDNELLAVINKGLEVPGADKVLLNRLMGLMYERRKDWDDAISFFSKAFQLSFESDQITQLRNDLKRVSDKQNF